LVQEDIQLGIAFIFTHPPTPKRLYFPIFSMWMLHAVASTSNFMLIAILSKIPRWIGVFRSNPSKGGFMTTSKYELVGIKMAPTNQKTNFQQSKKTVRINCGKWEN